MFWYVVLFIVVGVVGIVNQFVGIFLLKELVFDDLDYNIVQVGLYGVVVKLAVLMNFFIQAFNYVVEFFFFCNVVWEDKSMFYVQVGQGFIFVGCLAFVGIMLYMDVIQYYFGVDLWGGFVVVLFLLMAYFFFGFYYNFSIWYKFVDWIIIGGYIVIVGFVIIIGLNVWFIFWYGYLVLGLVVLACYSFMVVVSYFIGQWYYFIYYLVGCMVLYILGVIVVYVLSLLL